MPIYDVASGYSAMDNLQQESEANRRALIMAQARQPNTVTGMPGTGSSRSAAMAARLAQARLQGLKDQSDARLLQAAIEMAGQGAEGLNVRDATEILKYNNLVAGAVNQANQDLESAASAILEKNPGFWSKFSAMMSNYPQPTSVSPEEARRQAAMRVEKSYIPGTMVYNEDTLNFQPIFSEITDGGVKPYGAPTDGTVNANAALRQKLIDAVLNRLNPPPVQVVPADPSAPPVQVLPREPARTGYEPDPFEVEWRKRIGTEIMQRRESGPRGTLPYLFNVVPLGPRRGMAPVPGSTNAPLALPPPSVPSVPPGGVLPQGTPSSTYTDIPPPVVPGQVAPPPVVAPPVRTPSTNPPPSQEYLVPPSANSPGIRRGRVNPRTGVITF